MVLEITFLFVLYILVDLELIIKILSASTSSIIQELAICSLSLIFSALFFIVEQSHSSVERAGLLGGVVMREVEPDSSNRLSGELLEAAIKQDIEAGLFPFFVRYFLVIP